MRRWMSQNFGLGTGLVVGSAIGAGIGLHMGYESLEKAVEAVSAALQRKATSSLVDMLREEEGERQYVPLLYSKRCSFSCRRNHRAVV